MSNKDDYILFYSNKCLHSKELLNLLYKDPDLNQKFVKINIDNANVKIPPYIKSVPSCIINSNGNKQPQLLVGSAIFKWYKEQHAVVIEKKGIEDWDPISMIGFSDSFSYLDNNNTVIKKSFAFLNENNSIITPDEGSYGDNSSSKSKNNSNNNTMQYQPYVNEQQNNKFNNPFEQSGHSRDDIKNQKKSEMDSDYERFMNQRNSDVPSPPPRLG